MKTLQDNSAEYRLSCYTVFALLFESNYCISCIVRKPIFIMGGDEFKMRKGLFFIFFRIRSCSNNFFLVHLIIRRSTLACSPSVFADIFIVYETPSPKLSILSVCEYVPACLLTMSYCFLNIFFRSTMIEFLIRTSHIEKYV